MPVLHCLLFERKQPFSLYDDQLMLSMHSINQSNYLEKHWPVWKIRVTRIVDFV